LANAEKKAIGANIKPQPYAKRGNKPKSEFLIDSPQFPQALLFSRYRHLAIVKTPSKICTNIHHL
jgi:hypothetical protein